LDHFNPNNQVIYDLTSDGEDDLEELAGNTTGSTIILCDDDNDPPLTNKRSGLYIPTPRHKRSAFNSDSSKKKGSLVSFFARNNTSPMPQPPQPTPCRERPAHIIDPSDEEEEMDSLLSLFGKNTPPPPELQPPPAQSPAQPTRALPKSFMKASALMPTSSSSTLQPSNRPKTVEYRPQLSEEQQRVLDLAVKDNQSIFFTGSAGKSVSQ
jgi:hypothetical protein